MTRPHPTRWRGGDDDDAAEARALFESVRVEAPSAALRSRVRDVMSEGVRAPQRAPTTVVAAIVASVLFVGTVAAAVLSRQSVEAPRVRHRAPPRATSAPDEAPAPPAVTEVEEREDVEVRAPPPAPRRPAAPPPAADPLAEEASRLGAITAALERGDGARALALAESALAAYPEATLRDELVTEQIHALMLLDRRVDAATILEHEAIERFPRRRALLVLRGELRAAVGRCDAARDDFALAADEHVTPELAKRMRAALEACAVENRRSP